MRCAGLVLAMILLTGVAYGQIGIGGVIIPTQSIPANLPPLVFPSNSVMDHDGNLLIFETSVGSTILATLQGSVKTHIAVVSSDGKTKNGYDYNGSFQVVGVGQNAVYAIVTSIN